MLARLLDGGDIPLAVEMPADVLAGILHRDSHTGAQATCDNRVSADRVVAIERETIKVNSQCVSWHRLLNIEGTSLRIAALRALLAITVDSGCIDGRRVDVIA